MLCFSSRTHRALSDVAVEDDGIRDGMPQRVIYESGEREVQWQLGGGAVFTDEIVY